MSAVPFRIFAEINVEDLKDFPPQAFSDLFWARMVFAILDLSVLPYVTMFVLKSHLNSNLPLNRFHSVGLSLNSNEMSV